MKKLFALALVAALAAPAALAGGTGEYACDSHCPLAKRANTMRATGAEAVAASTALCADVAAAVEQNLDRI